MHNSGKIQVLKELDFVVIASMSQARGVESAVPLILNVEA